jgi:3-hydroxyisobutyrate dehydrogenase
MAPTVGFIGIGTMGAGMARNLGRAGFPLLVSSRTFAKARALAEELRPSNGGVRAVESFEEIGREASVIVSCLPDSPEVEQVHLGPRGSSSSAKRGTIVIDSSTIAAEAARSIAGRLGERGVFFLDAPVSGGQKGAIEGTLTFFVGGDAAAVETARPVFAAMGKRVTHLGPSGFGQLGKAVNQILVAVNLMAVSEALAFAARAGLPLPALHEALTAGAANSWALEVLGRKMIDRDFKPAFAIKHQQKDLAIVLASALVSGSTMNSMVPALR